MKDKKCFFCAAEKEFAQPCEKCRQLVPLCGDCCAKPVRGCGACTALKCFRCLRALSAEEPSQYITTPFKDCRTKSHSFTECLECRAACSRKLLADSAERFCFICLQELKQQGILYHNEHLDCAAAHRTVLCGPCHAVFKQVRVSCPACAPADPRKQCCVVCLREDSAGIAVLPHLCAEASHKLPICLDCSGRLGRSTFPCRYCVNKEAQHLVIFKRYASHASPAALLGCRVVSNRLRCDNLAVDPFCCPMCAEVAVVPFLLSPALEQPEGAAEGEPFRYAAGVCGLRSKALLSGGFSAAEGCSSAECWLLHFQLDGRFKEYSLEFVGQLAKRRHAHGAFFHEAEKRFYVLGGVCKDALEKVEYLDSVESLEFDPFSASEDSFESAKWTRSAIKLTAPRAHFSLHFRKGKLYVFGGVGAAGKLLKSVEVIDFQRGVSLPLIISNAELLPSLQPALHAPDPARLLLFGSGKEAVPHRVVELDFEKSSVAIRPDKSYSVSGDDRIYLTRAFDRLVAISGTAFGSPAPQSDSATHLKFRILGGSQPETVVRTPIEWGKHPVALHEDQFLFNYLCVEFEA